MGKLRVKERKFCERHGIPESRLFDATGLRPSEYREIMKADEKWAAFGVTPCYAHGHQLRNRHGTCLMCDTERLAYLFRTKLAGYIYVAIGAGGALMKIGFSTDPENRLKIANYEGWGGYSDWDLSVIAWSEEAGRLEARLHAHFADTRVPLLWHRNGRHMEAREAYTANLSAASIAMIELCDAMPQHIF